MHQIRFRLEFRSRPRWEEMRGPSIHISAYTTAYYRYTLSAYTLFTK